MSLEGMKQFESEIDNLVVMLAKGREKRIDLVEFMQECGLLFDSIEICLREGDTREKDTLFRKLKELNSHLDSDIQDLCKQCGKTEEEISAYIENPDSYSTETWSAIQKMHRRILSDTKKRKKR